MPSLSLTTVPNLRDIGGIMTTSGSRVRLGLVYRSEAVLDPDPVDADTLSRARIALICDLRGASERARAPNHWWRSQGVRLVELDILADIRGSAAIWDELRTDPTFDGAFSTMTRVYRELPNAAAPHLGIVAREVATGNLPVLIHCTAGKDRTGFLMAALLRLLGVSDAAIMEDYLASAGQLNQVVIDATHALAFHHVGKKLGNQALDALTGVDPRYLDTSFATITKHYGDFGFYLRRAAGLDENIIEAVKRQLLEAP